MKMKSLNFANCVMGRCQKVTFKVNFLRQKSSESFLNIFLLKNTNLGAHFLFLTFFDCINFWIALFSKMMLNFVSLPWKLHNLYCHTVSDTIFGDISYMFSCTSSSSKRFKPSIANEPGGFQLEFISISWVINHMTCYKFECSHWWKIYF